MREGCKSSPFRRAPELQEVDVSAAPFYLCCYGTLRDPELRRALLGQRADELHTRSGWSSGAAYFVATAPGEKSPRTGADFEPWPTFTEAPGARLPVSLLTGPPSLLLELLPLLDEYEEGYRLERRTAWTSWRAQTTPLLVYQYRGTERQRPSLYPWSLEAFQPFRAAFLRELTEERAAHARTSTESRYAKSPPALESARRGEPSRSALTVSSGGAAEAFLWHQEQLAHQHPPPHNLEQKHTRRSSSEHPTR